MSENKVLANLNRNLRSYSNSPAKNQKHLNGKVLKGSPLSARKVKKVNIANYLDNNENEIVSKSKKHLFTDNTQTSPNTHSSRLTKFCGLCGSMTKKLKLSECCGNYICDDVTQYKLFDFFSSCNRNHDRYSLCAQHFVNDHKGKWQECDECKTSPLNNVDKFNFAQKNNPQTYTCINCEFSAESAKAFLPNNKNGFYCQKKACREAKKSSDF
jgi:hypothetical protein